MIATYLSAFIQIFFNLFTFLIIVRILISWVNVDPAHPLVSFLCSITDPVLDRAKKIIPPIGMIDISPIIVVFAIDAVQAILLYLLQSFQ